MQMVVCALYPVFRDEGAVIIYTKPRSPKYVNTIRSRAQTSDVECLWRSVDNITCMQMSR